MERWLPIQDYPLYEVSSEGRIRNVNTGRILRQTPHPRTGIMMVSLSTGKGVNRTLNVHRIVASEFIGPPEQGFGVLHFDGDRSNNRLDNLEWKTLSHIREYYEDLKLTSPTDPREVVAIDLDYRIFPNALTAARELGGLEKYIIQACRHYGTMSYLRTDWVWKDTLDAYPERY